MDTGRSTSGVIVTLNGDCVMYKCKAQKKVCNSTAAAELYALADASRMVGQLQQIYFDISDCWQKSVKIFTDSQVVVKMLERGTLSNATKHLRLAYCEIKEAIDEHNIEISHIAGAENPADLLTKALPKTTHEYHTQALLQDDENFMWTSSKKG